MKTKNIKINQNLKKGFCSIATVLFFASCSSSDKSTYVPTQQSLQNVFTTNLDNLRQTATFAAGTTYTFTSAAGAIVTIDGSCLRKNGNPVTGMVDLEFVEMYDKGSMAITNKPTMGLNTLNELEPLDSGGEFYVVAKQGGVALTSTCPIPISVPTSNTGGTKPDMQAFEGSIDTNGNLTWESAPGLDFYYTSTPDKYNGLLSGFTWFNCDKFYNDPRPKTGLSVLIPSGYANASTVFISTNAKPNSLCGIGGHKFPVGLECNFIFVTEDNGKFRYAIKAATLINNHQETFSISETSLATAAELKAILNALP